MADTPIPENMTATEVLERRGAGVQEKAAHYLGLIEAELIRATNKHKGTNVSRHHHYGVIAEEFTELQNMVFKDFIPGGRVEAVQLAAMCVRFLIETPEK